jgi:hypothetical protein
LEVLNTPAAGRLPDLLEDDDEEQLGVSNTLFNQYTAFDKQSSMAINNNELEHQDTQ